MFVTTGISLMALAMMSVLLAFAERAAAKMRAEEAAKAAASTTDVSAIQVSDDQQ